MGIFFDESLILELNIGKEEEEDDDTTKKQEKEDDEDNYSIDNDSKDNEEDSNDENSDDTEEDSNDEDNYSVNNDDENSDDNTEDNDDEDNYSVNNDDENSDDKDDNTEEDNDDEDNYSVNNDDENSDDNTEEDNDDETNDDNDKNSSSNDSISNIEAEIFKSLTPQQKDIKNTELKGQFSTLYYRSDDIINKLGALNNIDSDMTKISSRIINTLSELKRYIEDYLSDTYNTKSYMENQIVYQKFLVIFNSVNTILTKLNNNITVENDEDCT